MATYKIQVGSKTIIGTGAKDRLSSILIRLRKPLQVRQYAITRSGMETMTLFGNRWEFPSEEKKAQYNTDIEKYISSLPDKISTRSLDSLVPFFKAAKVLADKYIPLESEIKKVA